MREICTYKKIKKTAKVKDARMNKCRNQEKKKKNMWLTRLLLRKSHMGETATFAETGLKRDKLDRRPLILGWTMSLH